MMAQERDEDWLAQDGAGADGEEQGLPSGEVYDWYQRGVQLLDEGDPATASQVLGRAAARVPHSRSVLEALARAQFDSEQYVEAVVSFERLVEEDPDDDYAQFGWGLSAAKLGQFDLAVEHLAVAAAMRPDVNYYTLALRGARATARAHNASSNRPEAKKG
jgi:Flp pilus assembly protein TadD